MAMPDPVSTMAAVHSTLPVAEFVWLLLLASITTIVARWIPVPHTVALVLVGLLVSAAGLLRVGSDTIGPAITSMAHDPTFIAVLWATGMVKLLGGFLPFAHA